MKAPMRIGLPCLQDATPSNTHDISRDQFMLTGALAKQGYDWWWHSFTGYHAITGQKRAFFIEFFLVNPALAEDEPVFGQLPQNKAGGKRPSYLMVKAGCWGQHARQLHRFFPWREVAVGSGTPYYVAADDCLATETDLVGRVNVAAEDAAAHPEWMCDDGRMMWDLHVDKQIAFDVGYGASEPMRASGAFEMFWHVQQDTLTARLVTDIRCPKREMLLVNYEAPDGAKRHNRLWNGGTGTGQLQLFRKHRGDLELIDDIRAASVGCEYGEYDD